MFETVRQYAQQRLDDRTDGEHVRAAHARFCVELVERETARIYSTSESDAVRTLDREIDNIHAALTWATRADPGLAVRLTAGLRYYWEGKHSFEGLPWLDAALALGVGTAEDVARLHWGRALQLVFRLDFDTAMISARTSLRLFDQLDDDFGRAIRSGHRILPAAILPRRTAHDSFEGRAEGAFGFIAERQGDGGYGIAAVRQPVAGEQHAPARQIFHR